MELILFIFLLVLSGFFSSSETSMFSLNSIHLEQMRRDGNPRISLIEDMLSKPRRLIVTILIGNEFVNVAASVLSASMIIEVMGAENKLFNILVMVPVLLIFGEITPKTLAIKNNIAFATFESKPIDLFARLTTPVRWAVRTVSEFFTTLIVGRERSHGNIITVDMVRTLVQNAVGEGALDHSEAKYINKIFEFGSKDVGDLMTPRADITFIALDDPLSKILSVLRETRQSRIPVYVEHRDNIIGILHVRDLLGIELDDLEKDPGLFRKLLREPYFVPESKPALELFDTFRARKLSFALTVDEYGGITGLVTMEDLLECIFGDIPSPSDCTERFEVKLLDDGRYLIDGSMPLDEFDEHFSAALDLQDVETIGGLVLHECGELPNEGCVVVIGGYRFTVLKVAQNRIVKLQLEPLPANVKSAGEDTAETNDGSAQPPEAQGD
ncbi:MAG: hemolysin family protein [Gammaproteobacteria bacterium]|nr:hemolysin family protein [Gammaproteobacteria bacterium]